MRDRPTAKRRYKVSARWTRKGTTYFYGQSEIGNGFSLWRAVRLWTWLLVRRRTVAKITRKRPSRLYFSGAPVELESLVKVQTRPWTWQEPDDR